MSVNPSLAKLRSRLVWRSVLLACGVAAMVLALSVVMLSRRESDRLDRALNLDTMVHSQRVRIWLGEATRDLKLGVERFAACLERATPTPELSESDDSVNSMQVDRATACAESAGLDYAVGFQDGKIVSSYPWREQAGLAGQPVSKGADIILANITLPRASSPFWVRSVSDEPAHWEVGLRANFAAIEGADWVGVSVGEVSWQGPWREVGEGWIERQSTVSLEGLTVEARWRSDWASRPWQEHASPWLLLLLIPAALLGYFHGRRVTQPIDVLLDALNSVSRGEADYTFSRSAEDEFDEVVTAFSTMRRTAERERLRAVSAERVATWREVARQVAHEVKNPLAPIRLTVENLQKARKRGPELFDSMFETGAPTILQEVDRLAKLVSQFAEFARLPEPKRTQLDLAVVIQTVQDLYAGAHAGALTVEVADDLMTIDGDREQLERALGNVVGNALEAQADGERTAKVVIRASNVEGPSVLITVDDDGPGIQSDMEGRLFDPYVTGKASGTGLGLAITERIIFEHGGVIRVEAAEAPLRGARFLIQLPGVNLPGSGE